MHKEKKSGMYKVARFIVQKRKAFLLLFAVGIIYSVICIPKVSVNYDITKYLPEDTDTRRGLTIMEEEFTTYGTANVLVKNITYETAEEINEEFQAIDGVKMVEFNGTEDHYKDSAALYAVTLKKAAKPTITWPPWRRCVRWSGLTTATYQPKSETPSPT